MYAVPVVESTCIGYPPLAGRYYQIVIARFNGAVLCTLRHMSYPHEEKFQNSMVVNLLALKVTRQRL